MAKKTFANPFILLTGWGGDGSDTGGGSGGTSDDITLCTFQEWLEMYAEDTDLDDDIDFDDYSTWWADNELDLDFWRTHNPGKPDPWTP